MLVCGAISYVVRNIHIWKCWHKLWDDTIVCVCVCMYVCVRVCVCVCVYVCVWSGGCVTLRCCHSNIIGCACLHVHVRGMK